MVKILHPGCPELAPELEKRLVQGGTCREMEQLMALQMAISGTCTLAQMAVAVGRSHSTVCEWMRSTRKGGLETTRPSF